MRKLVSFTLLLVSAAAVQAQTPLQSGPVEPGASTATVEVPAPNVDLEARGVTAADVSALRLQAPVPAEMPIDADAAQGIDTPRNFWWLVGGIVLAGIILAVIL